MVVANWPIRARHLLLLCYKLSYTKWAVDHNPTPFIYFLKCRLLSSLAQANLFEILTVSMESAMDSWVRVSRQLFKQRLKRSCFMVLLESSEGRKSMPWMLQLVFNKILTIPLDKFWFEKHGCSGGREGGWGRTPPPTPFPTTTAAMTVAEFVCMVSIFYVVLPKFVIMMTIIL